MDEFLLLPISTVIQSEAVDEASVRRLASLIRQSGVWTHPIPVCRETGLVMDGNHRLRAAEYLGFARIPVYSLSYGDARVQVYHRSDGSAFELSRLASVIATKSPLPYKTTRHVFEPPLAVASISIELLRARIK